MIQYVAQTAVELKNKLNVVTTMDVEATAAAEMLAAAISVAQDEAGINYMIDNF
jgi:hypothetical protein